MGEIILKLNLLAQVGINQLETRKEELPRQRKHIQLNGACKHTTTLLIKPSVGRGVLRRVVNSEVR